jgi:hypothetical protein
MSRFCALAAWLCTMLGLSLLVCSPALVPDAVALADDGYPPCGSCYYSWNENNNTWSVSFSNCTGECACPGTTGWSAPRYTAEIRQVECTPGGVPTVSVISCLTLCNTCPSATYSVCGGGPMGGGPAGAAGRWHCNNICICVSNGLGPFCAGP